MGYRLLHLYKILITRIKDKHVQEAGKKIHDIVLVEEFLADNFNLTKKVNSKYRNSPQHFMLTI